MAKHGKKYRAAAEKVEHRPYQLDEAMQLLKKIAYAKFNETVELSMLLGVDPKHADQMVRGTTVLPHGTGQTKRVLVIASGDKQREATEAGADFVGGDDMVEKVQGGWVDYDAVIATPDMMRSVGKLGKVLGPEGRNWAPTNWVLNGFKGLTGPEVTELGKQVRETRSSFLVGKNTLALIAIKDSPMIALKEQFSGPTAVAFNSSDAVGLAKALTKFAKDVPSVQFTGAMFAGQLVSGGEILAIDSLPSRNELLSK